MRKGIAAKTFEAKYRGICANCDLTIYPGTTVRYDAYDDVVHEVCPTPRVDRRPDERALDTVCPECSLQHAGGCF